MTAILTARADPRSRTRLDARTLAAGSAFAALLLLWAIVVRGPFLEAGPINHDDALYWMIGSAWRHGVLPYTQYWDLKPPGIFVLYAGADAVFGADPSGIRIFAMVSVWISGLALWALGTVRFGRPLAGAVAAILYVTYTRVWFGLACEPELFQAPLTILAALLVMQAGCSARPRFEALVAGLMMGAAFTLKQTAALEGVFFCLYLGWRTRDLRRLLAFALGALLPAASFAVYFAAHDQLGALWDAAVVAALHRTGGDASLAQAPVRFLFLLWPVAPLALGAGMAALKQLQLGSDVGGVGFLTSWLGVMCLGILLMHAALQYYFLPLLAPLSLLCGLLVAAVLQTPGRAGIGAVAGLAVMVVFPFLYFPGTLEATLSASRTPQAISDYLKAEARGRPMSLLVLDYDPYLYQASGLRPVTNHPLPMQLVCPFPVGETAPGQMIADAMANRPDFLVVSESRHRLKCELSARATLALRLGGGAYRLDRRFKDPLSTLEVWRRY